MASRTSKWLLGVGGGLLVSVAAIGATYYWLVFHVPRVTAYEGVQLGMAEGEVQVNFGRKPDCLTGDMKTEKVMGYTRGGTSCETSVTLQKYAAEEWRVSSICGPFSPSGVNLNNALYEESILEKLGKPSTTSVAKSGLTKVSSFKDHNLAITFSAKKAIQWCVTTNLPLKYVEEFQGS